ncbi:gp45.2 hypothetical phage protein [Acinetobacter phage 133]|uniref:Gp45.2 hypothetical phage protein n=1 Tax=Acinetobacter phage 133 TaxID=2919552 RepID=Q6J2Q3_9CAUD|nr:gp45.2 hypothetical phage protein [Acinetobacter phage 133]AAT38510.1 gp45.2 hypothetical phage protein [Acinetobacter phage 133]
MLEINELECYPEVKQYTLICLYNNEEFRVTDAMLRERFKNEDELARIRSGRHELWLLVE